MAAFEHTHDKWENFDGIPIWLEDERVLLVLGLVWQTLVGSQLQQKAIKTAQSLKATHYVHASRQAQAVGVAKLPLKKSIFQKHPIYSAALLFAQGYPEGLFAAVISLPAAEGFWMIAVRDGTVIAKSDQVFATEEEAYAALEPLSAPGMQVLSFPNLCFLGTATQLESARLQRVGRNSKKWGQWIALTSLLTLLVAKLGWDYYQEYVAAIEAEQRAAQRIDPSKAWADATEQFFQQQRVLDAAGFETLLQQVLGTPVMLGGWGLMSQQCQLDNTVGWRCVGVYERKTAQATNETFNQLVQPDWKVVWQPLDRVTVEKQLALTLHPLASAHVLALQEQNTHILSDIQSLKSVLQKTQIGKLESIRITPPVDDRGVVEKPADFPQYSQRKIRLEGPLRALAKVPSRLIQQVGWNQFQIFIHRNIEPNSQQSMLQFVLEGAIYAKE